MRLVAVLVVAAITLSACGSVSPAEATRQWMSESDFHSSRATLVDDATKSVTTLKDPHSSVAARRTICQVLFTDAAAATSSLPSPDSQANALLGSAYTQLGNGARECYHAEEMDARIAAAAAISTGVVSLGLASLRLAAVTAQ